MFTCLWNYFNHYFNYSSIQTNEIPIEHNNIAIQNNPTNINFIDDNSHSLEIQESYKLIFSTHKNTPSKLEIILYKFYNGSISPIDISHLSSVFHYDNKCYKISSTININRYKPIISSIYNSNINHIVLPEHIYHNSYKHNEYIQVFPYFSQGDLFEYVSNNTLSIPDKLNIYAKCISIIKNLHNINIAHRDIKLENFLLSIENNNLELKLIDLDFASSNHYDLTFKGGTTQYISYEVINFIHFDNWFSTDIWATGIILYALLFNNFPWYNPLTCDTLTKKTFKNPLEPCPLFEDYFYNKHYTYWHKDLNKLSIDEKTLNILNVIFNYSFNLNWYDRIDISYIEFLLNTIN